jgi:hypothetical protein
MVFAVANGIALLRWSREMSVFDKAAAANIS